MNVQRYTKKPVTIEATEYLGNADIELAGWCGGELIYPCKPDIFAKTYDAALLSPGVQDGVR